MESTFPHSPFNHPPSQVPNMTLSRLTLFILLTVGLSSVTWSKDASKPNNLFDNSEHIKKVNDFEAWYKDRNPTVSKIALGARESASHLLSNISVYAIIESLSTGDSIFEAPEALSISMKAVEDSPVGPMLKGIKELEVLTDLNKIALYYLYYKNCHHETFFWKTYFDILPDAHELNHPVFFTTDELKLLEGSHGYSKAAELRSHVLESYDLLKKYLFSDDDVEALTECSSLSLTDWKWAMATVLSRHTMYNDLSGTQTSSFPVILPYFDLIGHIATVSSSHGRTKEGIYHAELERNVDGEILRGITNDCNALLFAKTGLFHQDPEFPCATLPTNFMERAPKPSSPEVAEHLEIAHAKLKQAGLDSGIYHVFDESITEELLLKSEMSIMTLEEFESIDHDDEQVIEQIQEKVRIRALRWLASAIADYLTTTFPTSIQDDQELMKSSQWDGLSRRAQLAFKVVLEEKQVLKKFVEDMEGIITAIGAHEKSEL